jgi:hypothetical protein
MEVENKEGKRDSEGKGGKKERGRGRGGVNVW